MKTNFNELKEIPDKKIVEGIKACYDNHKQLYDSSLLLESKDFFGIATSLFILSIEQLVKALSLIHILISENDKVKVVKNIFKGSDLHKNRLGYALYMTEFYKNLKFNTKDFVNLVSKHDYINEIGAFLINKIDFESIADNVKRQKETFTNWFDQANELKNKGFYVAYGNNNWHTPGNIDKNDYLKALKETELFRDNLILLIDLFIKIKDEELDYVINLMREINRNGLEKIDKSEK